MRDELDRWILFFLEGKDLDGEALPDYMDTPEMKQAMETFKASSEKEKSYHLYQARLHHQLQQRAIQRDREELLRRLAGEKKRTRDAEQGDEDERRGKERLLPLLREKGIDPSSLGE